MMMLKPASSVNNRRPSYKHVPLSENDLTITSNNDDDDNDDDDEEEHEPLNITENIRFEPLEMASLRHDREDDEHRHNGHTSISSMDISTSGEMGDCRLFYWSRPWPLSVGVTFMVSVPTLLGSIWIMFLFGQHRCLFYIWD